MSSQHSRERKMRPPPRTTAPSPPMASHQHDSASQQRGLSHSNEFETILRFQHDSHTKRTQQHAIEDADNNPFFQPQGSHLSTRDDDDGSTRRMLRGRMHGSISRPNATQVSNDISRDRRDRGSADHDIRWAESVQAQSIQAGWSSSMVSAPPMVLPMAPRKKTAFDLQLFYQRATQMCDDDEPSGTNSMRVPTRKQSQRTGCRPVQPTTGSRNEPYSDDEDNGNSHDHNIRNATSSRGKQFSNVLQQSNGIGTYGARSTGRSRQGNNNDNIDGGRFLHVGSDLVDPDSTKISIVTNTIDNSVEATKTCTTTKCKMERCGKVHSFRAGCSTRNLIHNLDKFQYINLKKEIGQTTSYLHSHAHSIYIPSLHRQRYPDITYQIPLEDINTGLLRHRKLPYAFPIYSSSSSHPSTLHESVFYASSCHRHANNPNAADFFV